MATVTRAATLRIPATSISSIVMLYDINISSVRDGQIFR
jgi:hypothetical protein